MSYAENTSVPVDRSQSEIKRTLSKYNATGFIFGDSRELSMVMFEMNGRRIKFILPIPALQPKVASYYQKKGQFYSQDKVDQETRRRWRCLLLAIKAKLETVESGISTFEEEFMSHIVLPNGQTVGEVMVPQITESYQNAKMPPLLGMRKDI